MKFKKNTYPGDHLCSSDNRLPEVRRGPNDLDRPTPGEFGFPYQLDSYSNYFHNNPRLIIKCNKFYDFSKIGHTERILVPIDPNNPILVFAMYMDSLYSGYLISIEDEISLPLDQWGNFEDVRQYHQKQKGRKLKLFLSSAAFRM